MLMYTQIHTWVKLLSKKLSHCNKNTYQRIVLLLNVESAQAAIPTKWASEYLENLRYYNIMNVIITMDMQHFFLFPRTRIIPRMLFNILGHRVK